MNKNNPAGVIASSAEATPSDNLFMKALNYEIPENMIETIKDSRNPNARPLRYISWSYAWATFKQIYSDASYRVIKNPDTHLPYFNDPDAGIYVETEITANGETQSMWLFVMDASNQAMRLTPYEYQKWNSYSKTWETKGIKAATMFDINKTLLRCLVKNMAIFGFGLSLYANTDLPEVNLDGEKTPIAPRPQRKQLQVPQQTTPQPTLRTPVMQPATPSDPYEELRNEINATTDVASLITIYLDNSQVFESNNDLKALLTSRKKALQSLNKAA